MTLEQLALSAEIVGGAGVIASLVYLAAEIRRQSRLNRLNAVNNLAAQWSDLMTSLHDSPELAGIWLKGLHDFDALNATEKLRFGAYFGRFLRNSEGLYLHWLDGTLDTMLWRGTQRTLRDLIILPGAQAWWRTRSHWYSDGFQRLLDEMIEKAEGEKIFLRYSDG